MFVKSMQLIIISFIFYLQKAGALTPGGTNVCRFVQSFPATAIRYGTRTIRSKYETCYRRFLGSCQEWQPRYREKTVSYSMTYTYASQRNIYKCCAGWSSTDGRICGQPICSTPCQYGTCIRPNTCRCNSQYEGRYCDRALSQPTISTAVSSNGIAIPSTAREVSVYENHRVVISCDVSVFYPRILTYKWFKDGVWLPEYTSKQLTFTTISRHNTGSYTCQAANQYFNKQSNSFSVKVIWLDQPKVVLTSAAIVSKSSVQASTVYENGYVILTCNTSSYPKTSKYRWSKDGNKLYHSSKQINFIANRRDSGNYQCEVKNMKLVEKSQARIINVAFFKDIVFTGNNETQNVIVKENSPVNFSCIASLTINNNETKIHYQLLQGNSPLNNSKVSAIRRPDDGKYTCQATLIHPVVTLNISTELNINVQYFQRIVFNASSSSSKKSTQMKIREGLPLVFYCAATLTYELSNNESIHYDIIKNSKILKSMKIEAISRYDNGTYLCEATLKHKYGILNISKTIDIVVLYPAGSPQNVTAISKTNSSIWISWNTPKYDGNSAIKNYTVLCKSINTTKTEITKFTETNMTDLTASTFYHIQVYANNDVFVNSQEKLFSNASSVAVITDVDFSIRRISNSNKKKLDALLQGTKYICDAKKNIVFQQENCVPVQTISRSMRQTIASSYFYFTEEVEIAEKAIENVVSKASNLSINETVKVSRDVFYSVNYLIAKTSKRTLPRAQYLKNARKSKRNGNNILKSLDKISYIIRNILLVSTKVKKIKLTTKNILFIAEKVSRSNITVSVMNDNTTSNARFPVQIASSKLFENKNSSSVVVEIPSKTFPYENNEVIISCILHRKPTLFVSNEQQKQNYDAYTNNFIQSYVVSLDIGNQKVENLSKPILLTFEKVKNGSKDGVSLIKFWDFYKESDIPGVFGAWSTEGIQTNLTKSEKYVHGNTTHLTNFALLLDVGQQNLNPLELKIVSIIGCVVSICCLLLTIFTFCMFRNLLEILPHKILLSLCISLCWLLVIFLIGARKMTSKLACQTIAALLHYLLLTTFMWMFVEAFSLYRSFVKVFGTTSKRRFFIHSSWLAWGTPLVVVVTSISSSEQSYASAESNVCIVTGLPFYISVFTPIICILLFNFVILVMVLRSIRNSTFSKKNENGGLTTSIRLAFSCNLLLGTTWMFGVFAVGKATMFFQWCFCISNSFQGVFLFIFYVVRNEYIRKEWLNFFGKKFRKDYSINTSVNEKQQKTSTTSMLTLQKFTKM